MTLDEIRVQLRKRLREIYESKLMAENSRRAALRMLSDEQFWVDYKKNMTFLPFGSEDQLRDEILDSRRENEAEIPASAIDEAIDLALENIFQHTFSISRLDNGARELKDQHIIAAISVFADLERSEDLISSLSKLQGFDEEILRQVKSFETLKETQENAAQIAGRLSDAQAKRLLEINSDLPSFIP